MDETRVRAIIREEIALAVKTLGEIADRRNSRDCDDPGTDALYEISGTTSDFQQYAYAGACEEVDEKRAADAKNPFTEAALGPADEATKKLIRDEVLAVLKEMSTMFHLSGYEADSRIGDRLDYIIAQREE